MTDNLDRFVNQLQEQIFDETREVFGSYAAEMALGKNADELLEIDGNVILKALGGLPEKNQHCAHLAAESLHAALDDYMRKPGNAHT